VAAAAAAAAAQEKEEQGKQEGRVEEECGMRRRSIWYISMHEEEEYMVYINTEGGVSEEW